MGIFKRCDPKWRQESPGCWRRWPLCPRPTLSPSLETLESQRVCILFCPGGKWGQSRAEDSPVRPSDPEPAAGQAFSSWGEPRLFLCPPCPWSPASQEGHSGPGPSSHKPTHWFSGKRRQNGKCCLAGKRRRYPAVSKWPLCLGRLGVRGMAQSWLASQSVWEGMLPT